MSSLPENSSLKSPKNSMKRAVWGVFACVDSVNVVGVAGGCGVLGLCDLLVVGGGFGGCYYH